MPTEPLRSGQPGSIQFVTPETLKNLMQPQHAAIIKKIEAAAGMRCAIEVALGSAQPLPNGGVSLTPLCVELLRESLKA